MPRSESGDSALPRAGGARILTVTANPSLDLLFEAETLVWDDANRVAEPRRRPGGQGVNAARAARVLGAESRAITLLGGRVGEEIADRVRRDGVEVDIVEIGGETRTFCAVRERATGRSLLVNSRGPACSTGDGDRLIAAADAAILDWAPHWLACCGSLPPGLSVDTYARIIDRARAGGVPAVVDCDGVALGLAARRGCDLLVPNEHEAMRLLGRASSFAGHAGAAAAARELRRRFGVPTVAITLGENGAVLASAEGVWAAAAPPVRSGSAVGAGDAFLAALMIALHRGDASPDALRYAVAAGSAALAAEGDAMLAAGPLAIHDVAPIAFQAGA